MLRGGPIARLSEELAQDYFDLAASWGAIILIGKAAYSALLLVFLAWCVSHFGAWPPRDGVFLAYVFATALPLLVAAGTFAIGFVAKLISPGRDAVFDLLVAPFALQGGVFFLCATLMLSDGNLEWLADLLSIAPPRRWTPPIDHFFLEP